MLRLLLLKPCGNVLLLRHVLLRRCRIHRRVLRLLRRDLRPLRGLLLLQLWRHRRQAANLLQVRELLLKMRWYPAAIRGDLRLKVGGE